jgi:hypothetical protein
LARDSIYYEMYRVYCGSSMRPQPTNDALEVIMVLGCAIVMEWHSKSKIDLSPADSMRKSKSLIRTKMVFS